jgi:transcriptional regulator with XRE-family HTH domain
MTKKPAVGAPTSAPTLASEQVRPGSLLRTWRKRLGLTQEQLAAKTGYSRSHVKRVERGVANPSPECRAAFAAVLGMEPAELFEDFPPSRQETEGARKAARRAQVRTLYAKHTMPELEELLGVDTTTIWRDVHALKLEARPAHTRPQYPITGRTCRRCGKPLRFRHPSDHANLRGRYHRECFEADAVVNTCPVCGKERRRQASHAHKKCCSYRCAQLYRWHVSRKGLGKLVRRYLGPARQVWLGRIAAKKKGRVAGKRPVEEIYPELGARVLELRAADETLRAIAAETGLTKHEVEGVLARARRARLSP